jgi:putative tryptophan/tyrosine transport system substrate-binding protein
MKKDRRQALQVGLGFLLTTVFAHAQAPKRPLMGFLSVNSRAAMSARANAFLRGLRELGYEEGRTIFIEYRFADAKPERLPVLAAELVAMKVQVIVTEGTTATRYAKQATSTIPIVMAQDPDPVGTGFVASLANPGGNITGLSNVRPDLSAKRLELLKETVPGIKRVVAMGMLSTPAAARELKESQIAAEALGLDLQYVDVNRADDIESAFRTATAYGAQAAIVLAGPSMMSHRTKVTNLAAASRLPTIYYVADFVDDGGLMSYGVTITDLFHRAAVYVDKILKGAAPASLPVEQPSKLTLVVNLDAAKRMGFVVPPTVLLRADRIVE